jgi:hypothetical protein
VASLLREGAKRHRRSLAMLVDDTTELARREAAWRRRGARLRGAVGKSDLGMTFYRGKESNGGGAMSQS